MEIKIGTPVSPGIAIGVVQVLDSEEFRISKRFIRKDEVQDELARWEACKARARKEIEAVKQQVMGVVKDEVSLIFDTHVRILEDPSIDSEVRDRIKTDRYTAEYAVSRVFRKVINAIKALEDSYFGQRVSDFIDIQRRLLRALMGEQRTVTTKADYKSIIAAHDLTPSQTVGLARDQVVAFITDLGGATSHTAILANALGIPAVVGLGNITQEVAGGETIIVDGSRGRVIINPDEPTRKKYELLAVEYENREKEMVAAATTLADETADGTRISYLANIEFDEEVDSAMKSGAAGLGLFRTEFIFARHPKPTEEDHFQSIVRAITALGGKPLTVRTLDFGADKFRDEAGLAPEENPFLGNRSLRLCLAQPEMFRTQLRAILRASVLGDVRLMLPMVGSLEELRAAKTEIDLVRDELGTAGIAFKDKVPIGIMVEVPSAALIADQLAKECDFFSIGTNDLVQYTLAVDRNNPSVGHLYHHTHPAVLHLIQHVIDAGARNKIPVSVCGEMAADTQLAVLLLGMGLRVFSTAPSAIPALKTALSRITVEQAKGVASACMALSTVEDIDAKLATAVHAILGPEFLGRDSKK